MKGVDPMRRTGPISNNTIWRLPRYLHILNELDAKDVACVSSAEMSEGVGMSASQIRQDLALFGTFGQQGRGYEVKTLREELIRILGVDRRYKVILVGAGHLGSAIVENFRSIAQGCVFQAAFDIDPAKIGKHVGGVPIRDGRSVTEYIRENGTDIAILTVPREGTRRAVSVLDAAGIRAIWNFTGVDIQCDALVENILFSDSLLFLAYGLSRNAE